MTKAEFEIGVTDGYPDWLDIVRRHVESLRYGAVEIVVHDSRVTQIEKIERVRLDKPATDNSKHNKL